MGGNSILGHNTNSSSSAPYGLAFSEGTMLSFRLPTVIID